MRKFASGTVLFDLPVGVLFQKLFPALRTLLRGGFLAAAEPFHPFAAQCGLDRTGRGEIVAQRDGHAVRGVETPGGPVDGERRSEERRVGKECRL